MWYQLGADSFEFSDANTVRVISWNSALLMSSPTGDVDSDLGSLAGGEKILVKKETYPGSRGINRLQGCLTTCKAFFRLSQCLCSGGRGDIALEATSSSSFWLPRKTHGSVPVLTISFSSQFFKPPSVASTTMYLLEDT